MVASLLFTGPAGAQDEDRPAIRDDSAVWSVIERAWRSEREGNNRWIENLLSADFVGWGNESPAPRDKASTRLWTGFAARHGEMLEYELYPLSIIVHGDTAVAHYLYTSAMQARGEPVKTVNGRFTDVLVRTADGWKFLSWHGGAD
jgi:hypothetical protein